MDAHTLIYVFDSTNPGVSRSFSDIPPLPGGIMSRVPLQPVETPHPLPACRQYWRQAS